GHAADAGEEQAGVVGPARAADVDLGLTAHAEAGEELLEGGDEGGAAGQAAERLEVAAADVLERGEQLGPRAREVGEVADAEVHLGGDVADEAALQGLDVRGVGGAGEAAAQATEAEHAGGEARGEQRQD